MNKITELLSVIRHDSLSDGENTYRYELIKGYGCTTAAFRLPLFSVRVGMTDKYGQQTVAEASDAFTDERCALRFYEKIVKNLATPIDLAYVLEDERVN